MFADRVRIHVTAGSGGDGSPSMRREAHVPRGGPDGGDGGRGGSVIMIAKAGLTSLGDYLRSPHVRATSGGRGARRRAHGRNGTDATVVVPLGTVARRHPEGELLGEVLAAGDRLVLARGGRGGRGNVHFVSPTHQAPRHYERGDPGEEGWIELELKLIADIGFVGAPNAGKSTLLAALTAARPEVGSYPFTTTTPNLGVLAIGDGDADPRSVVVADVPGLIEGAHEGQGLGHAFLRHVERCRVLLGVVNGVADDPAGEWRAVAAELGLHDPALLERPMRLAVTKQDLPEAAERWPAVRDALRADGGEPIAVSAHDGSGIDRLLVALAAALEEADRHEEASPPAPARRLHRFDPTADGWEVLVEADGLRVRGRSIERSAARTDFTNEESRDRFQRRLERMGVDAELRRQGARDGTLVRIGAQELEWGDEE
ncbi:MAG TPA: GTPase ObgE [Candidatus Limnocylindria bacterium]|nr:GTPase ObgE [Candidatus Limnocylindria bacterium]